MNEEFLWTVFELSARSGFNDDLIRPFPSDYLLKDGTKGTVQPKILIGFYSSPIFIMKLAISS